MELEDTLQPIKNIEACIEAVVFAAGYPVPYQKLAEVTGLGVREVKRLCERIAKSFKQSWKNFADGFQNFTVWLVGAIPTLLVLAVIFGGIAVIIITTVKKAKKNKKKIWRVIYNGSPRFIKLIY